MVSTFQNYTRYLVIVLFALFLAACETVPKDSATSTASSSSTAAVEIIDGVYVGSDTVEMLAVDVPDRIFKYNVPILGICYGFQLMMERICKESSIGTFKNNKETKTTRYLTIDTPVMKVPRSKYYFLHHDYVKQVPKEWSKDIVQGEQIWMAHHKNMIGVQFHPEKYQTSGSRFFSNWIKLLH